MHSASFSIQVYLQAAVLQLEHKELNLINTDRDPAMCTKTPSIKRVVQKNTFKCSQILKVIYYFAYNDAAYCL